MKFFWTRLWETLWFELVLSIGCAAIFFFGLLKHTVEVCSFVMILCIAANCIRLSANLRGYYRYSRVSRVTYYKTNLTVILAIALLASVLAAFNVEPLYTWLFFPFKLLYIYFGVHKVVSTLAISIIFVLVTVFVPVFVKSARCRSKHEHIAASEEKHNEKETQQL